MRRVIWTALCVCAAIESVVIVHTSKTPIEALEAVEESIQTHDAFHSVAIFVRDFLDLLHLTATLTPASALIDIAYSSAVSIRLARLCEDLEILHFPLLPVSEKEVGSWTFPCGGSLGALSDAIITLKKHFNFNNVNVIGDTSDFSLLFVDSLTADERADFDVIYFLEGSDVNRLMGKFIRPKGNRITIITTDARSAKLILKAQYRMHIGDVGYGNILPLFSALFEVTEGDSEVNLVSGNLVLADERFAGVRSQREFVDAGVRTVGEYLKLGTSAGEIRSLLLSESSPAPSILVLNQQWGLWSPVAKILNTTYTSISEVHFLGNTTSIPHATTAPIRVSGNFGNTDPISNFINLTNIYAGSVLAVDEANSRSDVLPNFSLELWNFTGGFSQFNATYLYANVIQRRERLGAATVASVGSMFNVAFMSLLNSSNATTPMVGAATTYSQLSSQRDYPYFVRTAISDDLMNVIIVQIFKRFGWTKCGLVAEDLFTLGTTAQMQFQQLMAASGITIVNDPKYQLLPSNVTSEAQALSTFRESLQHFIDTHVRVLLVIGVYIPQYIPVVLYELGMRRGDVIIIAREWLAAYSFAPLSSDSFPKAAEVMQGALQFYPDQFVGKTGERMFEDFRKRYGEDPSIRSCFFFDAAYAIVYALDWLVASGQDYMNATSMMTALRDSRFSGCTGTVSFEKGSNDRGEVRFSLETITFNGTVATMQQVGVYDPHGMTLLAIREDYMWPDGSTSAPTDMRNSTIGCPFEDRMNASFDKGQDLVVGLTSAITVLTLIFCAVVLRQMRRIPLERLREKREMEVEDGLVMASIVVDLLQLQSLSPPLHYLSAPLGRALAIATWRDEEFLPLHDGGYERVWIAAELWVAVFLLSSVSLSACKRWTHTTYRKFAEYLTYLVSWWLFVPVVSTLMDTFVCRHGVADVNSTVTYDNSYLESDCNVRCWRGSHLMMFVLATISLLLFIPLAVVMGTLWQYTQRDLHIKWSVLFSLFRTSIATALISLDKVARGRSPLSHGITFTILMLIYLIFAFMHHSFGYARIRLWHILAIASAGCSAMVSTARRIANGSPGDLLYILILCISWGLLAGFGILFQHFRLPALLYRRKGVDTVSLYKFAFQPANETILSNLQAEFEKSGVFARSIRRSRHRLSVASESVVQDSGNPINSSNN